ncbi:protein tipE isoform X1 [Cimex lectularius]|uniref:Protein tipE n=1 Tax=Cimex lectularius TaxID=79782 RepID=A0A8I6RB05_CIMLE|nr:protein tipE isoform X1 [Cimex lectularius]XP_014242587.1 protein tipE isoform X1 [Cimex lectularius]
MAEQPPDQQTLQKKLLFYVTASFILLATFSLFAFLFLVPFVIEPAFTTIFMEFDETPVTCQTIETIHNKGMSNCSWTSCKEGCTKDVFTCTQIRVNYKVDRAERGVGDRAGRVPRAIRDYDYREGYDTVPQDLIEDEVATGPVHGFAPNGSEWYFIGAKLHPNVKGCGYPPMLNCTIWVQKHKEEGANFSCYYSRIEPGLVITDLDMWQVYMNLVYAMAIPIPSFIVSIIYLAMAYLYIYNDEPTPLDGEAEESTPLPLLTPVPPPTSGALTPASEVFREDLASFGHQLKVAMADDISRDSIFTDSVPLSTNSINGNLNKMMTTSIITPPGPIAQV